MLTDEARSMLTFREHFFATDGTGATDDIARPEIVASWRRSLGYGLDPTRSRPLFTEPGSAGQLTRAMRAVAESRRHHLTDARASLALTDDQGRILVRYVEDGAFERRLDHHEVLPGFSFSEASIGTNSGGLVLETGKPAIVRGPEHFFEESLQLTCCGAPIRHPLTRRVVGTLDLTCAYDQTSDLLLAWVSDLAGLIEWNLAEGLADHERALLHAYQQANRDPRQAVACLGDQTVMTNVTASRLLGPNDYALLRESVARRGRAGDSAGRLTLSGGRPARVWVEPVQDRGREVGVLVRLRLDGAGRRVTVPARAKPQEAALPGLVGQSTAWRTMAERLARAGAQPTVLAGERGTGKSAVARAWLGAAGVPVSELDIAACGAREAQRELEARADPGPVPGAVILRHLDRLAPEAEERFTGLLTRLRDGGVRVVATSTIREDLAEPLINEWFAVRVEVPAIEQRLDDVAELLEELSWRQAGGLRRQRWNAAAVQLVTRATWPSNVAGLAALVRSVITGPELPQVTPERLPAQFRARVARRRLSGLERIEAQAMIEALERAGGNKKAAAQALGIARSSLYRKACALGIDLDAARC
jgi:transcriptional regulator of acetoin/glycerol metabolism